MKAAAWHRTGDIRIDALPEPRVRELIDTVVHPTTLAISGTDLHSVRGTLPFSARASPAGIESRTNRRAAPWREADLRPVGS